eukprot:jgi/Mesvir1/23506/Mv22348-RA.1
MVSHVSLGDAAGGSDPATHATAGGAMPPSSPGTPPPPVWFSHDGGVDDYVTLALLCGAHHAGRLRLLGVSVTEADCFLEPAVLTSRKLLDLANLSSVPVSICPARPVHAFPSEWRRAAFAVCHLPALLRDGAPRAPLDPRDASECLLATLREEAAPITVLETGPLSLVAGVVQRLAALDKEEAAVLRSHVKQVCWMGGAVDVNGNVFPTQADGPSEDGQEQEHDSHAEWNVYWDAPSARQVVRSGIPIVLCPLDVTNCVPITTAFVTNLAVGAGRSRSTLADLVAQMYAFTMRGIGFWAAGYYAWDVLTLSYLLWPEIFGVDTIPIDVVVEGKSEGRTRRDAQAGVPVSVLMRVDAAAWETRLITALCDEKF